MKNITQREERKQSKIKAETNGKGLPSRNWIASCKGDCRPASLLPVLRNLKAAVVERRGSSLNIAKVGIGIDI
ncbi:MAG: hypothetical protein NG747_11885 [Candidatus Brocadia sp.]|nr:hypothetical protein [Candidatus Brocadia sp.]